ncbi:MAG: aquaporin [Actinobacteria bacterium]|nr:aquaporin [Actinomycetota bacterium]
MARKLITECIGTFLLVFLAVGAAVSGLVSNGGLAVALAFGIVLMGLAYAIGPTSGCHVNPAVTLAFWVSRRQDGAEAIGYIIAQCIGAIIGGAVLFFLVEVGGVVDETEALGSNGFGGVGQPNALGAFVVEALLTAAFVGVILLVTDHDAAPGFAGLAIGGTLAAVHLVGIPLTGTSVNPARSLGPALFAGGESLTQLWLFLVAPLVGGLIAVAFWAVTRPSALASGDEGEETYSRQA